MIHRYAISLILAAVGMCACSATTDGTPNDEETLAQQGSEALTIDGGKWCITHTFGLRYLRETSGNTSQWNYNVYNYYGQWEGTASAWNNGSCPHGIGVYANAYGRNYGWQCCAP
jgi:hypothetical protein